MLPNGFDTDNALRKLQNWIDGDGSRLGKRQEEKKLNKKEEEHPDNYYVRTVSKKNGKRTGVVSRLINDKKNYRWISDDINIVSSESTKLSMTRVMFWRQSSKLKDAVFGTHSLMVFPF